MSVIARGVAVHVAGGARQADQAPTKCFAAFADIRIVFHPPGRPRPGAVLRRSKPRTALSRRSCVLQGAYPSRGTRRSV